MRFQVRFDRDIKMIQILPRDDETAEWCRESRAYEIIKSVTDAHMHMPIAEDPPPGIKPPPEAYRTPSRIAAEIQARLRIEYPNAEVEVSTQRGSKEP